MTDTPRRFLRVLIDAPGHLSEVAAILSEDIGARGVELRDETTLAPPDEPSPVVGRAHVVAWLDPGIDKEALSARLLAELADAWARLGAGGDPAVRVDFQTVDAEDWVRKVREAISPIRLGRRVLVRPTWAPVACPEDDLVEIVLDPGLAFGTGHHATTALCLEGIEEALDELRAKDAAPRVLDVGTGSGVLAIAAAKMGAARCVGTDNDPMAVRVAGENARENGVEHLVEVTSSAPDEIAGEFDLVVANIHLGTLVELAAGIAARLAPRGRLLLSGLLEDQAAEAEAAYVAQGLVPRHRDVVDGWALVTLTRSC